MPGPRHWALTLKARCEKHPGFRPAAGEPGIRGGCETCWRLIRLAHDARQLQERAARLNAPEELRRAS